jgi:transcriptional regulator with XRE-family HTH domain
MIEHVDTPRAFGKRLREARVRAGLSQRELAQRAAGGRRGISYAYLSRLEAGQRTASGHAIDVLAAALDVDPLWLALGIDPLPALLDRLELELRRRIDHVDAFVARRRFDDVVRLYLPERPSDDESRPEGTAPAVERPAERTPVAG